MLALGTLGWLDFRLNMFLNVMTPLIMVISFSDSMQLTFAARDWMLLGKSKSEALRYAVLVVGPACVLTHATAAVSFICLAVFLIGPDPHLGEAGLVATLIALVAVLMLVPLLGVLLVHKEATFTATVVGADRAVNVLRRVCGWIAIRMVDRAALYSAISVLLVGGLAYVSIDLEPPLSLADQVPDRDQAVKASSRLDVKLTGANPVTCWSNSPRTSRLCAENTRRHRRRAFNRRETSRRRQCLVAGNAAAWLAEKAGKSDVATLKQYVEVLPEHLVRRFIAAKQDAVVVSGPHSGCRRQPTAAVVQGTRRKARRGARRQSGLQHRRDGLAAIAARNSATMIDRMKQG